jgi:DNA uptake protein ComE-like DNA-binding protein
MNRRIMVILSIALLAASLAACSSSSATPTSPAAISSDATTVSTAGAAATSEATVAFSGSGQAATCARLNLNTLSEDQLKAAIPNFPDRMVREFFEYRPYVSIQQFRREISKYVDAATVAGYERYVYVPIDPNNADADTLRQIPGVTDAVAASLTSGRPYATPADFLRKLAASISADQFAEASCLVATS